MSVSSNQTVYGLGDVWTDYDDLLGTEVELVDIDPTVTGVQTPQTGMKVIAVMAKNNTGSALLPSEIAAFETSAIGTQFDGKCGAAAIGMGVVDPYIPAAGVPDGSSCFLIVKGPVKVIHAGNDTIVAGDGLVTAANGRVDKYDGAQTASTESTSRFGRALATPANNSAGTKFRAVVDFRKA